MRMRSAELTCERLIGRQKMCGRSACSRDPERVRHACAYRPRGRKKAKKPKWVSCNSQKYYPSYNVSPQSNTPVLVSSQQKHIKKAISESTPTPSSGGDDEPSPRPPDSTDIDERVLQTMKWGLVPSWHKGDPKKPPTLLNNCRFEGMLEKPSFRTAIQRRQRCVVLADGFYEWDRKTSSHKQPYFIFFTNCGPTEEMLEVSAESAESGDVEGRSGMGEGEGEEEESVGVASGAVGGAASCDCEELDLDQVKGRMLTMAGLFEIWRNDLEGETLYTYTVITVEAHSTFAHIHDRMPAILDGEDAIRAWLDPSLTIHDVIHLLHPTTCLAWYPVSNVVNNVRNKTPECIMKIDPTQKVSSKQNTLMKWFSKSPKKETPKKEEKRSKDGEEKLEESPASKKRKVEDR